jgi:hydroxypyruvate isomerase
MKKSLSIETMFTDVPFYDRFAKVRAAGFDYIEFEGWTELVFSRVTELLNRHGLGLASISGARPHALLDPARHEDFLEFLSQTIAVAKCLSCTNIIIASESDVLDSVVPGKDGKCDFAAIAAAIRTLTEASAKAVKAGITLLVASSGESPANSLPCHVPSAGDVVKLVSSPALRLLHEVKRGERLDAGPAAALRKYRDVIQYVQVTDAPDSPRPAATSLADIGAALTRDLGYAGIVGFKLHPNGDEAQRLEEIRRF